MIRTATRVLSSLVLFAAISAAADDPRPVGTVVNLSGSAVAERAGEAPRPLHCRDAVFEGERVKTRSGSTVGLLVGDVHAQLGEKSTLGVGLGATDTADLVLESGGVRVIDPREAGPEARLAVLDSRAQLQGNDAEGYVFAEKTGGYAMFCEWDAPLAVSRADQSAVARAGQCVIAKRSEPLYVANGHDARLASPGADVCAFGPVAGGYDHHLDPTDVAAGPLLGPWSSVAGGTPLPPRSPCDVPGSGCGSIIEPPPSTGGVPGGIGSFPGAGVGR